MDHRIFLGLFTSKKSVISGSQTYVFHFIIQLLSNILALKQKNHSAFFDNTGDNQILDKIKSATYKKCNEYRERAFLLQTHFFLVLKNRKVGLIIKSNLQKKYFF